MKEIEKWRNKKPYVNGNDRGSPLIEVWIWGVPIRRESINRGRKTEMTKLQIEPIKRSTLEAREVAVYLGVSIDTVYKLTREKAIPHIRIGSHRILFKKDSIDRWLCEMEEASQ